VLAERLGQLGMVHGYLLLRQAAVGGQAGRHGGHDLAAHLAD
jgi:hypothetical protein